MIPCLWKENYLSEFLRRVFDVFGSFVLVPVVGNEKKIDEGVYLTKILVTEVHELSIVRPQ